MGCITSEQIEWSGALQSHGPGGYYYAKLLGAIGVFQVSCDYKRQVALSSSKIRPLCTEIFKNRRAVTSEDEIVSVTLSQMGSIIILVYQAPSDSLKFSIDSIKSVSCIRGFLWWSRPSFAKPVCSLHHIHYTTSKDWLSLSCTIRIRGKHRPGQSAPKQVIVFTMIVLF